MKIISRQEAIKLNLNKYFTGIPCKFGHIAERYVNSSTCFECKNRYTALHRSTDLYHETRKKRFINNMLANPALQAYHRSKNRAKIKNIPFNITVDDIKNVWPTDNKCPVFGYELSPNFGKRTAGHNSPSLDRIDSTKGYIVGNIVIISYRANVLKNNSSIKELEELLKWWKDKI